MKSSRPKLMSSLAAAVIAAAGAALQFMPSALSPTPKKTGKGKRNSKPGRVFSAGRTNSARHYPEQSTRQQHRGARRAQGGPGLSFDSATNSWWPRDASENGERSAA